VASCRECGAPIIWGETPAGKMMPLNAEPIAPPRGTWALTVGKTRRATLDDIRLMRPLHEPHWATCPDAKSFRK
jgi:hypothetical protein